MAEGKITEQKHNQIVKNVEAASKVLERVPMVDENGKKLNDKDASELLYLKIKEQFIKDKLNKDIPEKLKEKYKKELSDNQQKIDKIYKGSLPQNIGKPFAGFEEGKMGEAPVLGTKVAETPTTEINAIPVQEGGKAPVTEVVATETPVSPEKPVTEAVQEGVKPTDIEAKKADIERRKQEDLSKLPNNGIIEGDLITVKSNEADAIDAKYATELKALEGVKAEVKPTDVGKIENKDDVASQLVIDGVTPEYGSRRPAINTLIENILDEDGNVVGKREYVGDEEIAKAKAEGITGGSGAKPASTRTLSKLVKIGSKQYRATVDLYPDGKASYQLSEIDAAGNPVRTLTESEYKAELATLEGGKKEVKPTDVTETIQEQKPSKKENINIKNIADEKGNINTYSLKAAIVDAPALINVNEKTVENTVGHLRQIADKINDKELNDTVTYLEDASNMLLSIKNMEKSKIDEFLSNQENFYSDKKPPSEVLERLDNWAKVLKGSIAEGKAERLLKEQYQQVLGEIEKRFVNEKQQPNRPKLLEAPEVKPSEAKGINIDFKINEKTGNPSEGLQVINIDGKPKGDYQLLNRAGKTFLNDVIIYDKDIRGKGYGLDVYKAIIDKLNGENKKLYSTNYEETGTVISPQALSIWAKLEKEGYAKKIGEVDGMVRDREVGINEMRKIPIYESVKQTEKLSLQKAEVKFTEAKAKYERARGKESKSVVDKLKDEAINAKSELDDIRNRVKVQEKVQPEVKPIEKEVFKSSQGHTVDIENGKLIVRDKKGEVLSDRASKKAIEEYAENFDYSKGEKAPEVPSEITNSRDAAKYVIEESSNPVEIAEIYASEDLLPKEGNAKFQAIAEYGLGRIKTSSYKNLGDPNKIEKSMYLKIFSEEKGLPIDVLAKSISDKYGINIEPQDVVDYIEKYSKGDKAVLEFKESDVALQAADKFNKLTGLDLNSELANKVIDNKLGKANKDQLDIIKQDYETAKQLEDAYWAEYKKTDGFTKESNISEANKPETARESQKKLEEAYKDLTNIEKRQIINSKFEKLLEELKIEKICPTD